MADVEATLRSVVQPGLLPDEQILGVSASPIEPGRGWSIAITLFYFLGILPGVLLALYVFLRFRKPVYVVATSRRIFTFDGRVNFGFVHGLDGLDLGTIASVEESFAGPTKRTTLNLRNGGKVIFTKFPREAQGGLSAATTTAFVDGFSGWLSAQLPQLQAQPALTKAQLKPPDSISIKRFKMVNMAAIGLSIVGFLGWVVYAEIIEPMSQSDDDGARRARLDEMAARENAQGVASLRALGGSEEAKTWLAAYGAAPGTRFIGVTFTRPSQAELDAVVAAAQTRGGEVASFSGAGFLFDLGYEGEKHIQHRFSRLLGRDLSDHPVRFLPENPNGTGRVQVEIHVTPAAGGRSHRYDRTRICPLFDATATITATVAGAAPLTTVVNVPAPTDEDLRSDYWQRLVQPNQCADQQASLMDSAVVTAVGDLFLGAGTGLQ